MRFTLFLALFAALVPLRSDAAPPPTPPFESVSIPSPAPTGDSRDDTIYVFYYRASGATAGSPAPAVLLLHALGDSMRPNSLTRQMARSLAAHGINAAAMVLPWHDWRAQHNDIPAKHFLSPDSSVSAQAFDQSAWDVSAVLDWLARRPEVDAARLGLEGVSLGAIVTHIAMGRDARISAGVAALGGGNLQKIAREGLLFRLFNHGKARAVTPDDLRTLAAVDPLTSARTDWPRNVLMIQAARDVVVPPASAAELWERLGRPRIVWLDTNHFAPQYSSGSIGHIGEVWLAQQFGLSPRGRLPASGVPTIKVGIASGLGTAVTPFVELQLAGAGMRRDHMRLFHLDAGLSGNGPYLAAAATLSQFLDIGAARLWFRGGPRLFFSFHTAL